MDISEAAVHRLEIPLAGSYETSYSSNNTARSEMVSTLVILSTPNGQRGIGTADAVPNYSKQSHDEIRESLVNQLLPTLIDESPQSPNELHKILDEFNGHENAKCALEMAYIDLYCRQRGESVAEFFGGRLREEEPLNAWVGTDTPEKMAQEAQQYSNRGFSSLKMKFGGDVEKDLERFVAIQDAVGEKMDIRADVNTGYTVNEAKRAAKRLESHSVIHLEQPVDVDEIEGLAEVTASSETVIMADECVLNPEDVFEILSNDIADRVKLKILRMGGMIPTARALDTALLANISCVVGHGFCLSPAASAEIQLISSRKNVCRPAECVGPLKMADEPFEPRLTGDSGKLKVPNGPGLGIDLLDNKLNDFTVKKDVLNSTT